MRRFLCFVLSVVMVLVLCSCGVPQEDYDALQNDYVQLQQKYDALLGGSVDQTSNDSTNEIANKDKADQKDNISDLSSDNRESDTQSADPIPSESFFTYSGSGDDVITGLKVEDWSMLKVTHTESGHFAVKAHYSTEQYGYDLLINTTNPYNGGTTLLHPDMEYTLEINAKGNWNVEAFTLGTSATDSFSGSGDVVTPFFVPTSNAYSIVTEGAGHFAVKGYYSDGKYDLLVNTTDPYDGTVFFNSKSGYCFFVITGERDFMITPK